MRREEHVERMVKFQCKDHLGHLGVDGKATVEQNVSKLQGSEID